MLDARELQAISREARKAKETQKRIDKEGREKRAALDYENDAKRLFGIFFPQLTEKVTEIANQGWSSCGVQIPKDDVVELDPDLTTLRGVGKLLYDEYQTKSLKPLVRCELYDQGPEYSSAERKYYIEIVWDTPSEREKYRGPHINTLRQTTPLIRWCHLTSGSKNCAPIQVDYPE